jgi:L-cysteine S-thiosulfotransferase
MRNGLADRFQSGNGVEHAASPINPGPLRAILLPERTSKNRRWVMLRFSRVLPIALLLAGAVACDSGRHSSAGFRLPADGNIERGKAAFVALGCASCHQVPGTDLPRPTIQPPVPVALGGERSNELTDGYLVTSIICPSYRLAHYPKNQITSGGKSRMPDYEDRITVRQLTDLVAFLQSRYTVRLYPGRYPYY